MASLHIILGVLILPALVRSHADFDQLANGLAEIDGVANFTGVALDLPAQDSKSPKGYAYYGIRYANAQRFEHSTVNTEYAYLQDTNSSDRPRQGYRCPQVPFRSEDFPFVTTPMNEDCLFMDIYTPPIEANRSEPFPVLLWVHGGGFTMGDKDMYDARSLAASVKAIVATINYRLGHLGFLSSGDGTLKGNYAVGDIKTALNWVIANIGHFGGDKDKITLFGESAGGAMVSAVFLDEDVRAKVRAAVAMSGSTASSWGEQSLQAPAQFLVTCQALGCNGSTPQDNLACLKSAPFGAYIKARGNSREMIWIGPVIDGIHIKGHPLEVIQSQKKSEAVFVGGSMKEDSSLLLFMGNRGLFEIGGLDFNTALGIIAAHIPQSKLCRQEMTPLVQQVVQFYNITPTEDEKTLRRKTIWATTAPMFEIGAIKESMAYANRSFSAEVPNYHYLVEYDPQYRELGSTHVLDVLLLFRGSFERLLKNITVSEDASANFRDYFRQIAHNGQEWKYGTRSELIEICRYRKPPGKPVGSSTAISFQTLAQNGQWAETSRDFSPSLKLWNSIEQFKCPEKVKTPVI